MAIFKCLNHYYISTTQEILKKINGWKKTKLSLAKVFNHIKFISRAIKCQVLPVGFRRNFYNSVLDKKAIQWKIGKIIMQETLEELHKKLIRLRREELGQRSYLCWKFTEDEWDFVKNKVEDMERSTFIFTKSKQQAKMEQLLSTQVIKDKQSTSKDCKGRLINLSNYLLSKDEEDLLLKGLEFAPTDRNIFKMDIAVGVEGLMKKLNIKDPMIAKEIRRVFIGNTTINDNLSKQERRALTSLRNNEDIVIALSDKGKITIILDKEDYEVKLESIIRGDEYEHLDKDPTDKIDKMIRGIAAKCKKENKDTKVYYKIVGEDTRWPSLFGNIKVHKVGHPMRAIVSSFGTVTEKAAMFVKEVLNHYVHSAKDSDITLGIIKLKEEMVNANIDCIEECSLASIDVVNMFTNISTQKAYSIIEEIVLNDINFKDKCEISKDCFMDLVKVLLQNSYFHYKGEFYRQRQGIPMGSGISPVVSDLVMLELEKQMWKLDGAKKLTFYKRYRDDSILLWKGSKGELQEFVEDLDSLDPERNLRFTWEWEKDGCLPFLDALISIKEGKPHFRVYNKPYSAGMLMNFNSFQDISIKKSIVGGEVLRYYRISDNKEEDFSELKDKLKNNDYPIRIVEEVMEGTLKKLEGNKVIDKSNQNYLSVSYPGNKRAKKLKSIAKKFGFKIAFKRNKTLGNIFSNKFKHNTRRDKGLIYSIKCHCGKEYIGETGKKLGQRIKQHKYAISRADDKNGIAVHSLECSLGINWDEAKTLEWEGNWYKRKVKESLWIQMKKPELNLSDGWEVRGDWN